MADINIGKKEKNNTPVLEVQGEVDIYTAPKLKKEILSLIDDGKYTMIIDLANVDFMDSSGLGVLVSGLKRVSPHDGKIYLIANRPNIIKIFNITGLDKVFEIYENIEEIAN